MKRAFQIISYILVATAACVVTMILCAPSGQELPEYKLAQLETLIQEKFIGETEKKALYDGAAAGMVSAMGDRWSYYMTAEEYTSYQQTMANAYVGIGITIQVNEEGFLTVLKVTPGSGAEEAGILPGDVVVEVEGQTTDALGTSGASALIRGEAGTQVSVTVRRGEQLLPLQVQRRYIKTDVAVGTMLDDGIGLIRIVNFDDRCREETVAAIERLREQGAKALIFDVRYNPGGYKHELVDLLDYLLPEGPLFRSEDYKGKVSVDESDAKFLDMPMAVLINSESYSAAEFFAAALKEYDAAILVGEATVGKGYFQETFVLADGSAANISTGKYCTPKGVSLANVGLTPDVAVEVDKETAQKIYLDTLEPMEDPQILAAIAALRK